jgi:hypothetical protein
MSRKDGTLRCNACSSEFEYFLIHNGFNDSAYAYCDTCGTSTLLGIWAKNIPKAVTFKPHGPIDASIEPFLRPCSCGGHFRVGAVPRCPRCRSALSADGVTTTIEKNAPGTKVGWRWQRSWDGIYSIVIDRRYEEDNWSSDVPRGAV